MVRLKPFDKNATCLRNATPAYIVHFPEMTRPEGPPDRGSPLLEQFPYCK